MRQLIQDPPLLETIEDWLLASQNGDTEAFGRLIEKYQRDVFGLVSRLTRREDVADDLTQETFISAWRHVNQFRGGASLRTWLMTIAINKTRSYWRWEKLRNWFSLDGAKDGEEGRPPLADKIRDPSREADPALSLEDADFDQGLQNLLDSFSVRQREVVMLRAQGLDLLEIASVLGLAVGTIKAHLFEAKKRLQKEWEHLR